MSYLQNCMLVFSSILGIHLPLKIDFGLKVQIWDKRETNKALLPLQKSETIASPFCPMMGYPPACEGSLILQPCRNAVIHSH